MLGDVEETIYSVEDDDDEDEVVKVINDPPLVGKPLTNL